MFISASGTMCEQCYEEFKINNLGECVEIPGELDVDDYCVRQGLQESKGKVSRSVCLQCLPGSFLRRDGWCSRTYKGNPMNYLTGQEIETVLNNEESVPIPNCAIAMPFYAIGDAYPDG
jgi:hypothetical protein